MLGSQKQVVRLRAVPLDQARGGCACGPAPLKNEKCAAAVLRTQGSASTDRPSLGAQQWSCRSCSMRVHDCFALDHVNQHVCTLGALGLGCGIQTVIRHVMSWSHGLRSVRGRGVESRPTTTIKTTTTTTTTTTILTCSSSSPIASGHPHSCMLLDYFEVWSSC